MTSRIETKDRKKEEIKQRQRRCRGGKRRKLIKNQLLLGYINIRYIRKKVDNIHDILLIIR